MIQLTKICEKKNENRYREDCISMVMIARKKWDGNNSRFHKLMFLHVYINNYTGLKQVIFRFWKNEPWISFLLLNGDCWDHILWLWEGYQSFVIPYNISAPLRYKLDHITLKYWIVVQWIHRLTPIREILL